MWLSLVERLHGVQEVASSNLVIPTTFFRALSSVGLEQLLYTERVTGSSPVAPTISSLKFKWPNASLRSWNSCRFKSVQGHHFTLDIHANADIVSVCASSHIWNP